VIIERFVVLGLAQVRSEWFRDLARWATSAVLPVEFVKAVSAEEVRVRLRSGRGYSALLIDDGITGLDRDLIDLALEASCAVIVVDGGRRVTRWDTLGVAGILPVGFEAGDLLQLLRQVASPIARADASGPDIASPREVEGYRGALIAVTGPAGTGRSTVAMAIAQSLGEDPRRAGLVCLADMALHADLALLHDSPDVVPGLLELVEAHRGGAPSLDTVRSLTWEVDERGYRLLLGLRRHRDWTLIRPRALDAALDSLRRAHRAVVCDVDDDLEGERESGSLDIEERNSLARAAVTSADLVVVVATPGVHGLHGLLRVARDLVDLGVSSHRLLPLINRAPRSPRARAEVTQALGELLSSTAGFESVPSPVFLPERRNLDALLHDASPLPRGWTAPVGTAVTAVLERGDRSATSAGSAELVAVAPGTLGSWTEPADLTEVEGL
jgi:hypothetical protein